MKFWLATIFLVFLFMLIPTSAITVEETECGLAGGRCISSDSVCSNIPFYQQTNLNCFIPGVDICCQITIPKDSIKTDKEEYSQGEWAIIYSNLPYQANDQNIITDPEGKERVLGYGKGGPWIGKYSTFSTTEGPFGTYQYRVIIKREGEPDIVAITSFRYIYLNKVFAYCSLERGRTGTCKVFGSDYNVEVSEGGCGPNKLELEIIHDSVTETFNIASTEKASLNNGVDFTIIGNPCSVNVVNLRFEIASKPENTEISASLENIQTKLNEEIIELPLPPEEKINIIEARVKEEDKEKNIYIDLDNTKDVLIIKSNNVEAETKLPVKIEGSQLYINLEGKNIEINFLPDTIKEKAKTELDSVESIEIVGGSTIYLVEGMKDGKNTILRFDATTGEQTEAQETPLNLYYIIGLTIIVLSGLVLVLSKRRKRV